MSEAQHMTDLEKWVLERIRAANGCGYRAAGPPGRQPAKPFATGGTKKRKGRKPKRAA